MGTSAVFGNAVFGQAVFGSTGGSIITALVETDTSLSDFITRAELIPDSEYLHAFTFRERGTAKQKIVTVRKP